MLETIELRQRRFDEIDAAWAFDEGENDRSLEGWRQAHRNYFTRLGQFTPDMPLYCEHFRVVALIGAKRERCGGDRDMAPVEPSAPRAQPAHRGRGRRGPGG